jgi:hypothetical protein
MPSIKHNPALAFRVEERNKLSCIALNLVLSSNSVAWLFSKCTLFQNKNREFPAWISRIRGTFLTGKYGSLVHPSSISHNPATAFWIGESSLLHCIKFWVGLPVVQLWSAHNGFNLPCYDIVNSTDNPLFVLTPPMFTFQA